MAEPFNARFVDLVRNYTTTQGTGNFVLGQAVTGFTGFEAAIQPGESFYYSAIGLEKPAEREVGRGTLQADGTIGREAIEGSLTSFTGGTKTIALIAAAEWFEQIQAGSGGSALAIGLLAEASGLTIPPGTDVIRTSGHSVSGIGAADYVADAAVDAAYVAANPRTAFVDAAGRGFRLVEEQGLKATMFGILPDDSSSATKAANASALEDMLAFLQSTATAIEDSSGRTRGGHRLFWPKGSYHFANPNPHFSVKATIVFEGEQSGSSGTGAPSSRLIFDEGGFLVERYNTLHEAEEVPGSSGGDGSIFRGLFLSSSQLRPPAASYETDSRSGIRAYARVTVENCWIEEFTRDGVELLGGSFSGVSDTNVNCSIIRDCALQKNGRHGLYLDGGDANACVIENLKVDFNNNWGIHDGGFLQNHHSGHHASFNGVGGSEATMPHDGLTSIVTWPGDGTGKHYYVNKGAAAAASATEPGTDDSVWVPSGLSGVNPSSMAPLWTSGATYKEGGSYFHGGITPTVWLNTYTEGGQGQPWMGNDGVLLGGSWQQNPNYKSNLRPSGGLETSGDLKVVEGGGLIVDSDATTHNIGYSGGGGTPSQINWNLNFSGAAGFRLTFKNYFDGGGAVSAFIAGKSNALQIQSPATQLLNSGAVIATVRSTGFDLETGKVLKVGGTQVIGPQGAAVPDATGGATVDAEARAAINGLLAELRGHGLIAS